MNEDNDYCRHGHYVGEDKTICAELRADDAFLAAVRNGELDETMTTVERHAVYARDPNYEPRGL